jgi:uncharacterized protein YxjI
MPDEPRGGPAGFAKPQGETVADRVKDQVARQAGIGARPGGGGGGLLTARVLVVNQKAKIIELTNEYDVFDQDGNVVGHVAEVGQSTVKKLARLVSSLDQFMTHTFEIRDADGQCVLRLTRPRKLVKSSFVVERSDGTNVGMVKQSNVFGKIRFALEADGRAVGSLNAENWRAWDFHVQDATGAQVARITKTWGGLAKAIFTEADNYVLEITAPVEDPLRSLVVAAALCVDTALKQDARGLN